jgi:hypothetical protein
MKIFSVGKAFSRQDEQARESEKLRHEAEGYKLASDGGFMTVLKSALFVLFGYYNARLFLVTVPEWEGYLTAAFALLGEATALWCLHNYVRSAGAHKAALGVFGAVLTIFSVTHATISFFRLEQQAQFSGALQFYCERVAFPLLFGLLLLAAIVIPLCHWRKRIAQEQAATQVEIESGRARLVGNAAALKNEALLEHERLEHLRERIRLGNEYVSELESYAALKQREYDALNRISNSDVRKELANALGIKLDEKPVSSKASTPLIVRNDYDADGKGNGVGKTRGIL